MANKVMGLLDMINQDHHTSYNSFRDGLSFTIDTVLTKDNHYTLFRAEDWAAWVTFTCVFLVLIIFDNVILNRHPQALTVGRAIAYTLFWIFAACGFCLWVAWWKGTSQAMMWMSGYMLEWMLSFDNLFVFHLIFVVYGTPAHLKHRPLYLGILGAVFFRLVFIFIGEWLMHAMVLMHFVFGAFLVYTGIKTITADEEDEDPSQQPIVKFLQSKVPFISMYDDNGSFFVRVPVNDKGEVELPEEAVIVRAPSSNSPEDQETTPILPKDEGDEPVKYGSVNFEKAMAKHSTQRTGSGSTASEMKGELRATMLFLVVCCLEISDVLFAVDSVSAIVAQVNDLFLAYTSAVFAMLGLRATFFIIDVLVQLFSLLKYGVSAVLIFIGIKLIIGRFYHVPASVVCVILVTAIASSMIASVIQDKLQARYEGKMSPEVADRIAKVTGNTPFASPAAPDRKTA